MERLWGLPAAQVLAANAFERFPFLIEIGEDRFFRQALAGTAVVARGRPYLAGRGYFDGHYRPLHGETGEISGGMAVVRDVTESRLFQQQVEETESRFRNMADASPVMLWMAEADGLWSFVNQTWLAFTGRTLEQEWGVGWAESVHFEDLQRCLDTYTETFGQRRGLEMEYRLRRADGEYRWILDRGLPRYTPDGSFAGYIGSCIDITERRQLEQNLKVTLEQQRFLVRAGLRLSESTDLEATVSRAGALMIPDLADSCQILLLKEDRTIERTLSTWADATTSARIEEIQRRWPPRPTSLHGPGRVLATGQPEVIVDTDEAFFRAVAQDEEHLAALLSLGLGSALSIPLVVRDQTLGVLSLSRLRGRPPFDERDLATVLDLAGRTAIAVENAIHYRRAQEAIAFSAAAAHELRTPLATLMLQSACLLEVVRERSEQASPDPMVAGLESIKRQGKRLAGLLDVLLDVTELSAGHLRLQLEDIDMAAVVAEVVDRLGGTSMAAACSLTVDAVQPVVGRWDRLRLEEVTSNLLSNAVKYGCGQPVEVTVQGDERTARLVVRDHGAGIPPEDQARIFECFERAAPDRASGHGLGLWISRRIVKALGGELRVESRPGEGALFTVELPRRHDPSSSRPGIPS